MKKAGLLPVLLAGAMCLSAGEAMLPVFSSTFKTQNGNVSEFRPDDWCAKNAEITDGDHLSVRKVNKVWILYSSGEFGVTPGETLKGSFEFNGTFDGAFGLYCYDSKGMIGAQMPKNYNVVSENGTPAKIDFSIWVPDRMNNRVPKGVRFVIQFNGKSVCEALDVKLTQKAGKDILSSPDGSLIVNAPERSKYNPSHLLDSENRNLIKNIGFSYYAHGIWMGEDSKPEGTRIISREKNSLEAESINCDFVIRKKISLRENPAAMTYEAFLTVRKDFFIGGGDPPGGIGFGIRSFAQDLTHYARLSKSGEIEIFSDKDFPPNRYGLFENDFLVARCTPDASRGVILAIDSSFYRKNHAPRTPFLTQYGLAYPHLAYTRMKAGDVIPVQFHLIPFSGDLKKAFAEAEKALLPADPAERALVPGSRNAWLGRPLDSGEVVSSENGLTVFTCGPELILPEQNVPEKRAVGIRMSAAKGEYETRQIALRRNADSENMVSLDVSDLRSKSGAVIPKDRIEWKSIDSVPCSWGETAEGIQGDVPDVLRENRAEKLKSGVNRAHLLAISVPRDAEAGEYLGKVIVSDGGVKTEIPLTLTVFGFAIPEKPFFRTAFLAWGGEGYMKANNYSFPFRESDIRNDMKKLRISSAQEIHVPMDSNGKINAAQFKAEAKNLLSGCVTCIRPGGVFEWRAIPKLDRKSPEFEKAVRSYVRQLADAAREGGFLDSFWFLMVDETHWGEEKLLEHIKWCKWVKEEAPDLPIFSTQNHPEIRLAEVVDRICGSNSSTEFLKENLKQPKEYWLYENGFYFALGVPSITQRTLAWKAKAGGYSGYHQWSVCSWPKDYQPGSFHSTGSFYYPPDKDRPGSVVRSLRLVEFAEGMDDFDYLVLLDREVETLAKAGGNAARLERGRGLVSRVKEAFPDQYTSTLDADGLELLRNDIGTFLGETVR